MLERGRQLEHVRAAVQQLEQQKRARNNNPDDKLGMFRQQANLVAKKKEQVQQRLAMVRRDNAAVAADLQGKASQFEEVRAKPVLKGEEFRKYASELRGKTAQYKRMKQELGELRAEHGVLTRTQAILQQEANKVSGVLGGEEARRGLSGYQETQDELEKVSQQKADIDETKGKTLEEIDALLRGEK